MVRTSAASWAEAGTIAVLLLIGLTTGAGSITSKPRPETGPPSAWMDTAAAAWASLPMAALVLTHGPTPVSVDLVSTTVAPSCSSRLCSRVATSKLKACSG